jgi:hypothetical protein
MRCGTGKLTRIRDRQYRVITQRKPDGAGLLSPAQLVEAPIATLVPRAVWPGKPILNTGYEFSQIYYALPATVYIRPQ